MTTQPTNADFWTSIARPMGELRQPPGTQLDELFDGARSVTPREQFFYALGVWQAINNTWHWEATVQLVHAEDRMRAPRVTADIVPIGGTAPQP